ncbi:MAG: glycerol-3-phosphate acyltransferase, partial [Pseudomonadota bacterium]
MLLALKILLAYLAGSVSGSLVMGRLHGGVDIRTAGSGNAGGTNALRTQGAKFALGVIAIDIGKGALAGSIIANAFGADPLAALACVAAAVIGHVYPVWHGFRGGKGAA